MSNIPKHRRWLASAKKILLRNSGVFLLLVLSYLTVNAQTAVKDSTASISGSRHNWRQRRCRHNRCGHHQHIALDNHTVAKTATDEDGKYQLTALSAGQFTVMPMAKGFVVSAGGAYNNPDNRSLSLKPKQSRK